MTISSPSKLLAFLEAEGLAPKKSLSQNFLIDQNILKKIVKTAEIQPGDVVLEIGPGPGALTETLLHAGAKVIAVEKDRAFAEKIRRFEGVQVFAGDVRDFPFETLEKGGGIKVVANLPYHLTSVILALLLPRIDLFSQLTLMVQDEVAKRMTAKPNEPDFSSLSIFLNFYSVPKYSFTVSNRCFYPAPKVQSAVVNLAMKKALPDVPPEQFFPIVRKAFSQRRKMIRASLADRFEKGLIEETLVKIGCRKEARPENLSLDEWLAFYNLVQA